MDERFCYCICISSSSFETQNRSPGKNSEFCNVFRVFDPPTRAPYRVVSVSRFWCTEFLFHVEYYVLFLREIEYVATSFSPARTDLALKLLNNIEIQLMGVFECHQLTPPNKMVELKTHKLCVKNWVEFIVEAQIRIFLMDKLEVQVRILLRDK
jgi:hypothetical protein